MTETETRPETWPDRLVRWKAPRSEWSRAARTTLRTLHLLGMAAFFGAAAFGLEGHRFEISVQAAVVTGVAFAVFEIYRAPVWLVQVRGVATFLKVAFLAVAILWPPSRFALAILLVAIGSIISHAPAKYRYYSFPHRRAIESGGRG